MRGDMITMRTQMGQLMEAMQTMSRDQEEICQDNLRAATENPDVRMIVKPLGGTGTSVVTQPHLKDGPVNQNDTYTFNIHVHGGAQTEMDDHHDAFFIAKVDSIYDAFGTSFTEVDKKLCV